MVKQVDLNINGSYRWDFLKIVVWNCSMKEAMTGYFRKAPYSWSSISKNLIKMNFWSNFL